MSVPTACLGDLVDILSGFAFDAANFSDEGDIALIRIRDVIRGQSNTFYRGDYDDKYLIQKGDILIGMDGEFNRARWQSAPALLNQRVCKIKSSSPKLSDEYLFYFLPAALKAIEDTTSFVTVKHLSAKQIKDISIPLPPLEEQRRIAAILDQAETLRTQRRTAVALLDSLTQSLFLDMFGDPANNPMSWETLKVEQLAEQITDGEHLTPKREPQGVKLLSARNVRDGYIDFQNVDFVGQVEHERIKKRCNPVRGDVLISCSGSIGRVASVETDEPFSLVRSVAMIRPKTNFVLTKFLEYYLRTPAMNAYMIRRANASSQANLFQGPIREMPVTVPPLPLQQTFATRIQSIEALKATHRRALAALDALFASLQQRAFSGELARGAAQPTEELRQREAAIGLEALIYVAKRIPNGDHYKSLKAIYFADTHHLKQHGRLIYNETYCALPHGPVPQMAYDATRVLSGERLLSDFDDEALRAALRRQGNTLTALREADFSQLNAAMVESLDWAVRYCRDMTFEQTKAASHDSAYERTTKNEMIPLRALIDMVGG